MICDLIFWLKGKLVQFMPDFANTPVYTGCFLWLGVRGRILVPVAIFWAFLEAYRVGMHF